MTASASALRSVGKGEEMGSDPTAQRAYALAVMLLQIGSVIALVQMGVEHHAVAKGDFGHRISWVHILVLAVSLLVQVAGVIIMHRMR
jgi:hypothetical protein